MSNNYDYITATATIEVLRSIFSIHGLLHTLVSDNGPTFTSHEFAEFVQHNHIRHRKSAPYHPSTNGLAERTVQTFKLALKRIPEGSMQERLNKFLFMYCITPHSTTGVPYGSSASFKNRLIVP